MSTLKPNPRLWNEPDAHELLQRELAEAHRTIKALMRRLADEQEQAEKTKHAYEQMKNNIVELNREHTIVERERDLWRMRAEQSLLAGEEALPLLKSDEINAIRRAMARLHHPDTGGDVERMKQWNKLLDDYEAKIPDKRSPR
jgi:phenylalanine-4-hydroxylase